MVIDRTQFERRVRSGLIRKQEKGDLTIYNYTEECTWNKQWDRYTLMSRGLIVNENGKVFARPFPKFFNLDETEKTKMKNLPAKQPEIVEKLDGSLGILYTYEGELHIATRGSFESDQAIWATNWIRTHKPKDALLENITYLFEIIYPENRIVLDYGGRAELVLLGLVHNYTGKIFPYSEVEKEARRLGYSYPNKYNISLDNAVNHSKTGRGIEEGYVIFYPDEQLMVKLKLIDYVRLHRLMFGISVKSIWENMMYGQKPQEIFIDAPDEVMDWIKKWELKFNTEAIRIIDQAKEYYKEVKTMELRRDQALYLQQKPLGYLSIVFSMLDNKSYREIVYKMIKPTKEERAESFRITKEEK